MLDDLLKKSTTKPYQEKKLAAAPMFSLGGFFPSEVGKGASKRDTWGLNDGIVLSRRELKAIANDLGVEIW